MKKLFTLMVALFPLLFASLPQEAFAKKRYRYIKREHGLKMNFDSTLFSLSQGQSTGGEVIFDGAYSYNYKGRLEFGPYFGLGLGYPPFAPYNLRAGLNAEYNFIKNRGKRKMIPASGLSIGWDASLSSLELGLHTSLKYFVAKRTSIITQLQYVLGAPISGIANIQSWSHSVDLKVGFAYYFDFY